MFTDIVFIYRGIDRYHSNVDGNINVGNRCYLYLDKYFSVCQNEVKSVVFCVYMDC